MVVIGNFIVECESCNLQHNLSPSECEFEMIESHEGGMGPRRTHGWNWSFNCDCGQEIVIDYAVEEYPQGAFNGATIDITGASVIQEFDFEFH